MIPIAEPITTFSMFVGFSFFFVVALVVVSRLLRPKILDKQEKIPYECGELPVGPARNFSFDYYTYGVIYLVFEVSLAFILLMASAIKTSASILTMGTMFTTVAILAASLVYFYKEVRKIEV